VRPVLIVMLHIIVYDAFKLAAAEDEQPVESIPGVGCRPSARREAALGGEQLASLALHPHAKAQSERLLRLIAALEEEMAELEGELCRLARTDSRLRALQTIWAVGPILACHLRAEIGDARRFRRARQLVRAAGLDPVVLESAANKRGGRLAKTGSPSFAGRSSKPPNTPAATAAPSWSSTTASANAPARNEPP
jgi:Transposase IS116/IS110/IS902 family